MTATETLVDVQGLTVDFLAGRKELRAVEDIAFTLRTGEVLALLGESGSGKTATLRALMRLLPERRARTRGHVIVDGVDVLALPRRKLSDYRGRTVAMVFQEPGLALDPVYRLGDQIAEVVKRHEGVSWRTGRERALDLFRRVHIPAPERRLDNYPHELSGGMRQRAMIALALACRPKLLLADEPTTALDATVQIQILLLLRELQREFGLAVIFVTHDIGVAIEVADRIAVMYAGRIVETGDCRSVVRAPAHPYTKGLLATRPQRALAIRERLPAITGNQPDLASRPGGCTFAPRCKDARAACEVRIPPETSVSVGHSVRCMLVQPSRTEDEIR
ncbi:MAG TPA: ABC transporter ATP-binding protein [Xanthobacteraceae bacterium]|nr:ABC transporter ATP-binding protein [Xanthobacteraceae bacterium]